MQIERVRGHNMFEVATAQTNRMNISVADDDILASLVESYNANGRSGNTAN